MSEVKYTHCAREMKLLEDVIILFDHNREYALSLCQPQKGWSKRMIAHASMIEAALTRCLDVSDLMDVCWHLIELLNKQMTISDIQHETIQALEQTIGGGEVVTPPTTH